MTAMMSILAPMMGLHMDIAAMLEVDPRRQPGGRHAAALRERHADLSGRLPSCVSRSSVRIAGDQRHDLGHDPVTDHASGGHADDGGPTCCRGLAPRAYGRPDVNL
jgi:hypothetical protein